MENSECGIRQPRTGLQFRSLHSAFRISTPLCLSSYRTSFVNSYSSVRVRPEAPFQMRNAECRVRNELSADVVFHFALRIPHSALESGSWCNSSTSRCERDSPGANPGFLTNPYFERPAAVTTVGRNGSADELAQCSSGVEQRSDKPSVAGSNPALKKVQGSPARAPAPPESGPAKSVLPDFPPPEGGWLSWPSISKPTNGKL